MSVAQKWSLGLTVFIAYVGVSMPYPIMPVLFLHSNSLFLLKHVGILTRTVMLGVVLAAYPFGQLIGNTIIGILSDRYNRMILLCATLLFTGIGYLFTAYSIHMHSLTLLIITRLFTGLFEGNVTIAQSLMTKIDSEIDTTKNFSWIFMWCSLGFIVGPFIGGMLSSSSIAPWFSYGTPFCAIAILSFITIPFVYYCVGNTPQRNNAEVRRSTSLRENALFSHELTRKYFFLKILCVSLVCFFAIDLFFSFAPVYFVQKWNVPVLSLSYFSMVLSFFLVLTQGAILPVIAHRVRPLWIVTIALLIFPAALIGMLLTNSYYFVFLLIPFIAIAIASFTTSINVMIAQCVSHTHLGRVIGVMRSARALGDTLACLFAGILAGIMPKLPLIMVICLFLIALILFYFATTKKCRSWSPQP